MQIKKNINGSKFSVIQYKQLITELFDNIFFEWKI